MKKKDYEVYMQVVDVLKEQDNDVIVDVVQLLAGMIIKSIAEAEPVGDIDEMADLFIEDVKVKLRRIKNEDD